MKLSRLHDVRLHSIEVSYWNHSFEFYFFCIFFYSSYRMFSSEHGMFKSLYFPFLSICPTYCSYFQILYYLEGHLWFLVSYSSYEFRVCDFVHSKYVEKPTVSTTRNFRTSASFNVQAYTPYKTKNT